MHFSHAFRLGPALTAIIAFGLARAPSPAAAQTLSTLPARNISFGAFGVGSTATFGQTVTAPGDVLQDFTFEVAFSASRPLLADAEVYAWNGTTAAGPALFRSSPFAINNPSLNPYAFMPYTVTPNIAVTVGAQYVLLFTTSGLQGRAVEFVFLLRRGQSGHLYWWEFRVSEQRQ